MQVIKKTILVTGVTGTIGNATVMELAKNNCHLILLGRNQAKLEMVREGIKWVTGSECADIVVADLSEPASVKKAANQIRSKYAKLNALIYLAGSSKPERKANSLGHEYLYATNHLGFFILTNELLDLLKAGTPSRVITVAPSTHSRINFPGIQGKDKTNPHSNDTFGASQMMNIMFTYTLARRLEGTGVTTNVYNPGFVRSKLGKDISGFLGNIMQRMANPPEKVAKTLCSLAIDSKYETFNGSYFNNEGKPVPSSRYSHDVDIQEELWKMSEQLSAQSI